MYLSIWLSPFIFICHWNSGPYLIGHKQGYSHRKLFLTIYCRVAATRAKRVLVLIRLLFAELSVSAFTTRFYHLWFGIWFDWIGLGKRVGCQAHINQLWVLEGRQSVFYAGVSCWGWLSIFIIYRWWKSIVYEVNDRTFWLSSNQIETDSHFF